MIHSCLAARRILPRHLSLARHNNTAQWKAGYRQLATAPPGSQALARHKVQNEQRSPISLEHETCRLLHHYANSPDCTSARLTRAKERDTRKTEHGTGSKQGSGGARALGQAPGARAGERAQPAGAAGCKASAPRLLSLPPLSRRTPSPPPSQHPGPGTRTGPQKTSPSRSLSSSVCLRSAQTSETIYFLLTHIREQAGIIKRRGPRICDATRSPAAVLMRVGNQPEQTLALLPSAALRPSMPCMALWPRVSRQSYTLVLNSLQAARELDTGAAPSPCAEGLLGLRRLQSATVPSFFFPGAQNAHLNAAPPCDKSAERDRQKKKKQRRGRASCGPAHGGVRR